MGADKGIKVTHFDGHGRGLDSKYASLGRKATMKTFWRCMIFCMIANWAALNDGFQQQLPGNVIPMPAFVKTMADTVVDGEPTISARVISFWGGFGTIAQLVGQAVGGPMSDRLGRRTSMYIFVVLFLLGSSLEISAQGWKSWMGAQVVLKMAIGTAQSVLIVFVGEIAPFQVRGVALAAYQLFLAFGQLVGSIASQIMVVTRPNAWRPLIASEFLFTGVLILMLPFMPESHMYYVRKGDHEKAKRSMARLYGTPKDYDVDHEYRVVQQTYEAELEFSRQAANVSWLEIFQGQNLRRTIAGALGICDQPLSGTPIIFTYSTYFFAVSGLQDPFLTTVIVYIILLVFIAVAMALTEAVGRRPLFLGGGVAMLVFNVALAVTGSFSTPAAGHAALAFLLLWVVAYSLSAGPLGFVAAGETATPRLRGKTTSFSFFCYSALNVVFTYTIPYLISPTSANLGVKTAYLFAGLLLPTVIGLYFLYPETTGRTWAELDELYKRGVPARRFKSTTIETE
ncbi:hypothetical protein VTK73DRAFT_7864 [Phialemonium thermophilum]|uniref:Major facilitator superfamily (MFS) profile domain-containing protein n=1 Tax=Phialemonium thermophilum TaxID=223376 RepID=A0ABR3WC47_9PEZI